MKSDCRKANHAPSTNTAIPPPPQPPYRLLIVKWIGADFHQAGALCKKLRHSYALLVKPDGPVRMGDTVRLLAASSATYRAPPEPLEGYDTYDPHVFGRVLDMQRTENGMGRITVFNMCRGNMVEEVEIAFPYLPEILGRAAGKREKMELASAGVEATLELIACIRPVRLEPDAECKGPYCTLGRPTRL
ncbi:hypothetical protein OH76DRAFT_1419831 [Lentinus brumalis]|uniref:Uncharacterized protein n=1 Tax=Lentinus brumalis TaxID=2498619 RepID=A0A371D365_9APHY|nr:hypothetical protein OH76DRAFT_1419831 [Polyporus brumalis]